MKLKIIFSVPFSGHNSLATSAEIVFRTSNDKQIIFHNKTLKNVHMILHTMFNFCSAKVLL